MERILHHCGRLIERNEKTTIFKRWNSIFSTVKATERSSVDILYQDNHLLIVNKPPGLLTQGDSTGHEDQLSLAKHWLKTCKDKPGNVYLALTHRIDRNVSGILLFGKTSKAAARISAEFKERRVSKIYVAMVLGSLKESGKLEHWLAYDKKKGVTSVFNKQEDDHDEKKVHRKGTARIAQLVYKPLMECQYGGQRPQTLVAVKLITGRKHQIRAQLGHLGYPIVGDRKYGYPVALNDRSLALHCLGLELNHPVQPRPRDEKDEEEGKRLSRSRPPRRVSIRAPLPPSWEHRFGKKVVDTIASLSLSIFSTVPPK